LKTTFYLDVKNLFDTKVFFGREYNGTVANSQNYAFENATDFDNYMKSLHLDIYKDPYFTPLRQNAIALGRYDDYVYAGYVRPDGSVVQGEDKLGELRSASKSYINDPNYDIFTWGQTRQIWFGIKVDF
jgi:hypothetical protein